MFNKKMMKGTMIAVILVLLMAGFSGCQSGGENGNGNGDNSSQETVYLSYGAGTVGSAVNSVVLGHTSILNEKISYLQVSAEASGGGVDNIRYTEDDVFQISTAANISMWQAANGEGDFEGEPVKNVVGFIPIYPSYIQIVVKANSDIYSVNDLKGKRVSVGVKGSGAEVIAWSFFNGANLPYTEFKPYYLAQQESNDGLKDGSLDASFIATGIPTPAIMELMATTDVRIISVSAEEAKQITADYPFFSPGVIPGGTYDSYPEDIPTVQGFTVGFVRRDLSDDLVYEMAKVLWENKDELGLIHASQKSLEPEMIKSGLLPVCEIHPGAAKYYKEMGWID